MTAILYARSDSAPRLITFTLYRSFILEAQKSSFLYTLTATKDTNGALGGLETIISSHEVVRADGISDS